MTTDHEPYLKAIGTDHLLPFYDLVARSIMRERRIKRRVVEAARLPAAGRLLDIGCGTGTLTVLAKQERPDVEVVGIDGDPAILERARRKAAAAGVEVRFDEGMAYALPYEDRSFDAVVSTLTFHHLTPSQREQTLAEVARVLRPGGRLVIADFAPPHNRLMQATRLPLHALSALGVFRGGHGHDGDPRAGAAAGHHHGGGGHDRSGAGRTHDRDGRDGVHGQPAGGWVRAAPPERFMTLAGTLALQTLERPATARHGAAATVHAVHAG